jgi:hypothetical protein
VDTVTVARILDSGSFGCNRSQFGCNSSRDLSSRSYTAASHLQSIRYTDVL